MVSDELLQALLAFRRERDWSAFHTPRNLAISISLEAAELLEHFQWLVGDEDGLDTASERADQIAEEVADLAIYLSYLCHDLGIDLDRAVRMKLETNERRYPVDRARGRATKHSEL